MIKEDDFVKDLSCDELCVVTKKKSYGNKLKNSKVVRLAKDEMNKKMCPPC